MKKYIGVLLSCSFLLIASCNSYRNLSKANNAISDQNFFSASLIALDILEKDITNVEAQNLLEESYLQTVSGYLDEIEGKAQSNDLEELILVVSLYEELSFMNQRIIALQSVAQDGNIPFTLEIMDVGLNLNLAKQKAAEAYYESAIALANSEFATRKDYRVAYQKLERALEYQPGLNDALELSSSYKKLSTLKVVLAVFDHPEYLNRFGPVNEYISRQANYDFLINSEDAEFMEIVGIYPTSTSSVVNNKNYDISEIISWAKGLQADAIVVGRITDLYMGNPEILTKNVKEISSHTTDIESYVDPYGREVFSNFSETRIAYGTHYKMNVHSTIEGNFEVINLNTLEVMSSGEFSGYFIDHQEWARFSGDLDAVNGKMKKLMNNPDGIIPDINFQLQRLVNTASTSFISELTSELHNSY